MLSRKRQTVMLVDDNQVNLNIGKNMLKDTYEVYALPSSERLFKFLETVRPDLILLDISMPDMNGFDVLRILRANARNADIPVIFVTARAEETDELKGLALGAVDYVTKPFSAPILLKRIQNQLLIREQQAELKNLNENLIQLVKDKTNQVVTLQSAIIETVAEVVEFRDVFTGGHINRTREYVRILIDYIVEHLIYADEVQQWEDMQNMVSATQLHDLGKVFISDAILNKPGRLTAEEFDIMKTHVEKGVEAIDRISARGGNQSFIQNARVIAGTHHEKWDGTGYPNGLAGESIPLPGRLMAVADVYDALVSRRSYKEPFPPDKAAQIIAEGAGTQFDPVLVDIFAKTRDKFEAVAAAE